MKIRNGYNLYIGGKEKGVDAGAGTIIMRPTCSNCQEVKVFLAENNILYIDYDLSKEPAKE